MLRRQLLVAVEAAVLGLAFARPRGVRAAEAARRLALVIGNAQYPDVPLNNPTNDARLIAGTLRQLGFDVTLGLDLRRVDFLLALIEFAKQAREGADAMFYYAGHAVQIRGSNYLLPVDIGDFGDPAWIEQNAINLDGPVLRQLLVRREGSGVRLLFIDACRDNPFGAGARRPAALSAGLASVQGAANIDAGVLIASSAQPNKPAEDGPPGGHSVYTRTLARQLLVEGQNVEAMLKNVAIQVDRETQRQQLPMFASSLTSEFVFNTGRGGSGPVAMVLPGRSAKLTIRADPALNLDDQRRALRSALWIYVLRNEGAFGGASFEALYERAEATLGADLLAREKLTLAPGTTVQLPLDLPASARAIGVLVAFRDIRFAQWRAVLALPPADAQTPEAALDLRVEAGARSVTIAQAR